MITLEVAKQLEYGDKIYSIHNKNADGSCQRWKVNGKVKTWKRSPNKVKIPVKFGLYTFDYITENELHLVSLFDCEQ
jgi:hypothetical protein